jgi:hypothetical protein
MPYSCWRHVGVIASLHSSTADGMFPAGTILVGELKIGAPTYIGDGKLHTTSERFETVGQITHVIVGWTTSRWSLSDAGIEYAKVRTTLFPLPSCTKVENSASKSSFAWDTVVSKPIQSPNGDKTVALRPFADSHPLTAVIVSGLGVTKVPT